MEVNLSKKRVVITGLGTVNPLGLDTESTWASAKKGVNAIGKITSYDNSNQRVKLAAELKNYNQEDHFEKKEAKKMARFTQLAVVAAREAFRHSEISLDKMDRYRVGNIVSSGIGGLDVIVNEYSRGVSKGFDRVSPFFIPTTITNMASGSIAIDLSLNGISSCPVTACASSSNAIGDAFRLIKDGYMDFVLAGGSESTIIPLAVGGFTSMRALNETEDVNRASIPFDKERSGFVMGEGAAVLALEEYENAVKRGAKIYGEIVGYGSTCDAYHMSAPLETGEFQSLCMDMAVDEAQISKSEIEHINAHGTSTPMNDRIETNSIKTSFKDNWKDIIVTSTKSMTGHLLGASGSLEAILTTLSLKEGIICPTINYKEFDETCDLNICKNSALKKDIKYAISNSFGFGGHNVSLVFKKFEA